jgi:Fe-S cluster assembly iron-binding protein IscA
MIVQKKERSAKSEERKTAFSAIRDSAHAIHADMSIADIVALFPGAEKILATWGLHCVGCGGMAFEQLGNGVKSHGYSDDDVAELVDDLNRALAEEPDRPQTLMITKSAAEGFWKIAEQEGKTDHLLMVTVDGGGGFCMEFTQTTPEDAVDCTNTDVPQMKIFAPFLALKRIGGSTIDFHDERFKLDLPEAQRVGCACDGKTCACK